jgi:hypothetical protein
MGIALRWTAKTEGYQATVNGELAAAEETDLKLQWTSGRTVMESRYIPIPECGRLDQFEVVVSVPCTCPRKKCRGIPPEED